MTDAELRRLVRVARWSYRQARYWKHELAGVLLVLLAFALAFITS